MAFSSNAQTHLIFKTVSRIVMGFVITLKGEIMQKKVPGHFANAPFPPAQNCFI